MLKSRFTWFSRKSPSEPNYGDTAPVLQKLVKISSILACGIFPIWCIFTFAVLPDAPRVPDVATQHVVAFQFKPKAPIVFITPWERTLNILFPASFIGLLVIGSLLHVTIKAIQKREQPSKYFR